MACELYYKFHFLKVYDVCQGLYKNDVSAKMLLQMCFWKVHHTVASSLT